MVSPPLPRDINHLRPISPSGPAIRVTESSTHPLSHGQVFSSPGAHLTYRVIGPCCRLFDRNELPWPCCRLQWRGKEPSWRRIGRRLIPDLATQQSPSYSVEILEPGYRGESVVLTLYAVRFTPQQREWWYSRHFKSPDTPSSES